MKHQVKRKPAGSVIVMVSLAILMLFGMIGLVVDVGLGYYYRRAAQAAADAAAQAGARKAFDLATAAGNFNNAASWASDVELAARNYATANGFTQGGRQTVVITPNVGTVGLSAPLDSLHIYYNVKAQVKTRVSSLFSGGGGEDLDSGAVAIAAVLQSQILGSVYLLNRACDPDTKDCSTPDDMGKASAIQPGVDFARSGSGSIEILPDPVTGRRGTLFMNTSANGLGSPKGPIANTYATATGGSSEPLLASVKQFAWDGNYKGAPDYATTYSNGPQVKDPTYGFNLGKQPKVQTVQEFVDAGGQIKGVTGPVNGATLGPGVYVDGYLDGSGKFVFSGNPVQLDNVTFNNGGNNSATFTFLGGMNLYGSSSVTLAGGIYVAAGLALDPSRNFVLNLEKANITDAGAGGKGEMFLATRPDYIPAAGAAPLLSSSAVYPVQRISNADGSPIGSPITTSFATPAGWGFGPISLKSGASDTNKIDIYGVKDRPFCGPGDSSCDQLYQYQPGLIWQDRRNCLSGITGNSFTPGGCQGTPDTVPLRAGANAFGGLRGLIYQPRGSYFDLQGGSAGGSATLNGASTLVTGAINLGGSRQFQLVPLPTVSSQLTVSLIR